MAPKTGWWGGLRRGGGVKGITGGTPNKQEAKNGD